MFWKKKNSLPIIQEDKKWIEEEFLFLKESLGSEYFLSLKTITPTKNYFNYTFTYSEKDAYYVLKTLKDIMQIKKDIKLLFYSDSPVELIDGTVLTTPSDNIEGSWSSSSGQYELKEGEIIIYVEKSQLKNTDSLIATIAHELSHEVLLGENRIVENDEYLTDLTALAFGFGIFLGNSSFNFSSQQNIYGTSWEMNSQGYLPEQVLAYGMAYLSYIKNEPTDYIKYLNKSMKKYFEQSLLYFKQMAN